MPQIRVDHLDSAVSVYFQVGQQSHALDAQLQLLCQMLDKEAYAQVTNNVYIHTRARCAAEAPLPDA